MTSPADLAGLPEALADVSEERIRQAVGRLASDELEGRELGSEGGRKARELIIERLEEIGVAPAGVDGFRQEIALNDGVNIIGRIEGSGDRREEVILVGAHYDHLGRSGEVIYNGADDNASGVAILLEAARAWRTLSAQLDRSILIVAFDGEEPPYHLTAGMGSEHFVADPTVPLDRVALMIAMDLMGTDPWKGWEGRLFILGEEKCPAVQGILDEAELATPEGLAIARIGVHMVEEVPIAGHIPVSDYDAFRKVEVPFLFWTCGRPAHYHTPNDTAEKLNYPKVVRVARHLVTFGMLASRAEARFEFHAEGEVYRRDAEVMVEGIDTIFAVDDPKAAFPGYSHIAWTGLKWWGPKVRKIRDRLRAGESIAAKDVRVLEKASIALQTLSTPLLPI